MAALAQLLIDSSLAMSSAKTAAAPPAEAISAATSFSFASLRAASATFVPAAASARAQARPIPCEAPVTRAVLPSSDAMVPAYRKAAEPRIAAVALRTGRNRRRGPASCRRPHAFQRPDVNHQLPAVLEQGFRVGQLDAVRLRQIVDFELRFGQFQRPRQVVDIDASGFATARGREQCIAIRKEAFDPALDAGFAEAAVLSTELGARSAEQSPAAVVEPATLVRRDLHS